MLNRRTAKVITVCASASFYERIPLIEQVLTKRGHKVLMPSMTNYHGLPEDELAKIHFDLIKEHFRNIDESDAIYVANYDKRGIAGYIGGNCFLEIGKAFDRGIPIFLMQDIPKTIGYREELLAMRPILIGANWELMEKELSK